MVVVATTRLVVVATVVVAAGWLVVEVGVAAVVAQANIPSEANKASTVRKPWREISFKRGMLISGARRSALSPDSET